LVVPSTSPTDGEVVGELRLCFRNQIDLGERDRWRCRLSRRGGRRAGERERPPADRELADRTRYEASHDTLTGLINRERCWT